MIPVMHQEFLERAMPPLEADTRIAGVAIGGSYLTGSMDIYSDIDLVVAVEPGDFAALMDERTAIAESLGPLLSAFTGEHVGEPRLLVCLYGPPLLHVDLKFVSLSDIAHRVEDPAILWEREGRITKALKLEQAKYPLRNLQWMEDRFWVWVHYIAVKIARGELFEAIDAITALRALVIGPLLAMKCGGLPRGVRRLENDSPESLPRLIGTHPDYSAQGCAAALREEIGLYVDLREFHAKDDLMRRTQAQQHATEYLAGVTAEKPFE